MSIPEHELETLESWLDGELSDEQIEALRRRLRAEPQLAQALDQLRSDRQARTGYWQSLEPSDAESDRLVAAVRREVLKQEIWSGRMRMLRGVSGIAASILVVFALGWLSRGVGQPQSPIASANPAAPAVSAATSGVPTQIVVLPNPVRLPMTGSSPNAQLISNEPPATPQAQPYIPGLDLQALPEGPQFSAMRPTYKLFLVDPNGRIADIRDVGWLNDPKSFLTEMSRHQSRQSQSAPGILPRPGSGATLVNEQRPQ